MAVYRADTTTGDLDDDPKEQFIYHAAGLDGYGSASYIDAVILRDRDANTTGGWAAEADGTLEERRYYCQNWRHDVVAIVTAAGVMAEQVRYSAYGVPFGLPQGDVDGDGTVDGADQSILFGAWGGTYDVRADINLDGTVDGTDNAYVTGNWNTTLGWDALSEDPDDGVGNRKGYAGYEHDPALAASWTLYHVRHRVYNADLGRWTRRDPLGYVDGMSLYEYVRGMPTAWSDPKGQAIPLLIIGGAAGGIVLCLYKETHCKSAAREMYDDCVAQCEQNATDVCGFYRCDSCCEAKFERAWQRCFPCGAVNPTSFNRCWTVDGTRGCGWCPQFGDESSPNGDDPYKNCHALARERQQGRITNCQEIYDNCMPVYKDKRFCSLKQDRCRAQANREYRRELEQCAGFHPDEIE